MPSFAICSRQSNLCTQLVKIVFRILTELHLSFACLLYSLVCNNHAFRIQSNISVSIEYHNFCFVVISFRTIHYAVVPVRIFICVPVTFGRYTKCRLLKILVARTLTRQKTKAKVNECENTKETRDTCTGVNVKRGHKSCFFLDYKRLIGFAYSMKFNDGVMNYVAV